MTHSTHNILPKLQEALSSANISASDSVRSAGLYYDGEQHGELIPCVFVSNDWRETGINGETVARIIAKHLRHTDYIAERVNHPYYNVFRVMLAEDKERAERLDKVSQAFLEAFWQAIHDDPHARDNNSEGAINAGHAAIAKLA